MDLDQHPWDAGTALGNGGRQERSVDAVFWLFRLIRRAQ